MINQEDKIKKMKIEEVKKRIKEYGKELKELEESCSHTTITIKMSGKIKCCICGKDLGWECWNSPDQVCHYSTHFDQENNCRTLKLRDGTDHAIPLKHYNELLESLDTCLFCGKPFIRQDKIVEESIVLLA